MNAVGTDGRPGTESAAVTALVEAHRPLVDHLVREALLRVHATVAAEPLTKVATAALRAAARTFDAAATTPFADCARTGIRAALAEHLRGTRWTPAGTRTDLTAEARRRRHAEQDDLAAGLAALPRQLRVAITAYYYDQRPAEEIARDLGVTTARVRQLQAEALRRLQAGRRAGAARYFPPAAQLRGA